MTEETANKLYEFINDDNNTVNIKLAMRDVIGFYSTIVWHEPSEKPRPKTLLMLRMGLGMVMHFYSGSELVMWQWAYIDDLLPPK